MSTANHTPCNKFPRNPTNLSFTACIRRMGKGNIFSLCSHLDGRYPHLDLGRLPPSEVQGVPPFPGPGRRYPFPGPDRGVPPSQVQVGGTPFPGPGRGVPYRSGMLILLANNNIVSYIFKSRFSAIHFVVKKWNLHLFSSRIKGLNCYSKIYTNVWYWNLWFLNRIWKSELASFRTRWLTKQITWFKYTPFT